MSTIEAKVVKVEVFPHENADRLELALIGGEGGYTCVIGKGQFATNDLAIYIPDGAVVPEKIREYLAKTKITVKDGRIRCIKIRDVFSEGLCLVPSDWLPAEEIKEDNDVTKVLGITKWEPPPPKNTSLKSARGINFHYKNAGFKEYYCVEKFKKFPGIMAELSEDPEFKVVATLKFHGTNARYSIVDKPNVYLTWWEKIKHKLFGTQYKEFLVGSHNKIKKPGKDALKYGDYYNTDTWWRMAKKYDLESVIGQIIKEYSGENRQVDVAIYGEIFGPGVQKNYHYGVKQGDLELRVFDIMIEGKYLDWDETKELCNKYGLPCVDELYRGPWSLDLTDKLAEGVVDIYDGKKHKREGVVFRPIKETWHRRAGRVIFKYINSHYRLDKTNTEFH